MSGTKKSAKGGTPKASAKTAGARGAGGPPAGKEAQRAARRVEIAGVDSSDAWKAYPAKVVQAAPLAPGKRPGAKIFEQVLVRVDE